MALLMQFLVAFGTLAGRHGFWPIEASRGALRRIDAIAIARDSRSGLLPAGDLVESPNVYSGDHDR